MMKSILITTLVVFGWSLSSVAQSYPEALKEPTPFLWGSSTSLDGESLSYPFTEDMFINGWTLFLAPADTQDFHSHNTNMLYFVLEGSLAEKTMDGETRIIKQGQGGISAVNECHINFNAGTDTAKVLLVMFGSEDLPGTETESCTEE
ncbi:MAG TPA: hypothetical protein DEF03_03880 [Bacteroidetes bacterium]|nr:MAG: cupin domain-containing protein [Rhodothermaceae bacterium TMED105]HBW00315.1 hypothetical protein [Bacteroidota bacterium]